MQLFNIITDPEALLAMHPSELAGVVLGEINQSSSAKVHPGNFSSSDSVKGYPGKYSDECQLALMEAWSFLVNEGLLVPAPGDNHGWHTLSRYARSIKTKADYQSYLHSNLFPKKSIVPELVTAVYPLFLSGDYETAIFKAFKEVEVKVRDLCGDEYEEDYGRDLMLKAFNPDNGPLTNKDETHAERQALMFLFAGAIGRFKNPTSHRHVPVTSPQETIEIIQFASHLLRILQGIELFM